MSEPDTGTCDDRQDPDLIDTCWLTGHQETLDQVCSLLGVGPQGREKFCNDLCKIAIDRSINQPYTFDTGRAKPQKRVIGQLITRLRLTSEKLASIDSGFGLVLGGLTRESSSEGKALTLRELDANINQMIVAAQTFLDRYKPTRIKTDIALERAVSSLMDLIERELGLTIMFSQNAAAQTSATPTSDAARAMMIFLQAIGPKTTTTAIHNMVERLRADPILARTPFGELLDAECPPPTDPSPSGEQRDS